MSKNIVAKNIKAEQELEKAFKDQFSLVRLAGINTGMKSCAGIVLEQLHTAESAQDACEKINEWCEYVVKKSDDYIAKQKEESKDVKREEKADIIGFRSTNKDN